jgi:hypothetical protein
MVYRKGEATKKQVLRDWPHHVWTEQPANGFGHRLDEMHQFCRGRDYRTAGPGNRATIDGIWFCFRAWADAAAFGAWYYDRR